jgi:hypothetical protein
MCHEGAHLGTAGNEGFDGSSELGGVRFEGGVRVVG